MEGVLVLGLLFLWLVLWVMLIRHERRRAARGLPRHGAVRMLLAAAALLTIMFILGCALLVVTAHAPLLGEVDWSAVRLYVGTPFVVALIVVWLTLRRPREAR
jgi:hypothetical protein